MAIYALLDYDTLLKYDITIEEFIKTAKGLKAKILQYRDKNSSLTEKKNRLLKIRKLWKKPLIINDTVELLPYCDGIHIGQEDLQELCKKFEMNEYDVIEKLRTGELSNQVPSSKFQVEYVENIKNCQVPSSKFKNNQNFELEVNNLKPKTRNSKPRTRNQELGTKIVGLSTHNKEEILKANKLPLSYIGLGAYRATSTKNTNNILGEKIIELIKFSNHPVAIIGGVKIYDKIPSKFKVIGSDICKLTYTRLKKKKIFKMK